MSRPDDEHLTPEEIAELGALLVAERPRPSETFAAELDARVAARFEQPRPARRRATVRSRRLALRLPSRPHLPALAATATVALAAAVVALELGGQSAPPGSRPATPAAKAPARLPRAATADGFATPHFRSAAAPQALRQQYAAARKVERSTSLILGAAPDRIDDVAQSVLGIVAHAGGIVDHSTVTTDGTPDGSADFALRIPAGRLQATLAELSKLPGAHVLSRSDENADVNQPYVTLRRRLATAQAERRGLLRALAAAGSEAETLRLKARLDGVERTIAATERAQRGLNRRIAYSRVDLTVAADEQKTGGAAFTPKRAAHDAVRVLAVTVGALMIAAAALAPLVALLALGVPLARTLRRRRREQALDTA